MTDESIDAGGLRDMCCHAFYDEPVVFQDKDGKLHRIHSAISTRCELGDYYGSVLILRETLSDEFVLRIVPPTPELQERIDEYNKTLHPLGYE